MTWMAAAARLLLTLAAVMLAWRAQDVAATALGALDFLLSLDYGEGIVLQQALLVLTPQAYGDISTYPFVVFHYPPGFLLATRAAVALGLDLVLAGRLVSYAATLCASVAIGTLVWVALRDAGGAARTIGAAIGAFAVFAFTPVAAWMPLARVDMLAVACTVWGLVLAVRAPEAPWRAPLAAALFTAAVFTRQTALAAPLAATLVLLLASPREARRLVGMGLILSLSILGVLSWLTDGAFLTHVIGYNVNRYELVRLRYIPEFGLRHGPLVLLGALGMLVVLGGLVGAGSRLRGNLAADPGLRATLAAALYVGISTPLLALIAKSGSAANYFIEWVLGCALMIGILAGRVAAAAGGNGARPRLAALGAIGIAALVILQLRMLPAPPHAARPYPDSAVAVARSLIELLRTLPGTVISDDMLVPLRAGKGVPWEPAIFAELATLGRWDEALIVSRIREGEFPFAVTIGQRGHPVFDSRYTPAVADALEAAFPRQIRSGPLVVRLPADSLWEPP
jgi:hypothetical protein